MQMNPLACALLGDIENDNQIFNMLISQPKIDVNSPVSKVLLRDYLVENKKVKYFHLSFFPPYLRW